MTSPGMRRQRDQALASLILAIGVSLSVFLSVFGSHEMLKIESARNEIAAHESLLRDSENALRQNQKALEVVRAAFEKLDGAQAK